MALLHDKRKPQSLNMDDDPSDLKPEEMSDALNIRTASSTEEHSAGMLETMQGEVEIPIGVVGLVTYYGGGAIGQNFIYSGYEEVAIGNQVWMKTNWNENYPGSKVYNADEMSRDEYGGLYSWNQVMADDFAPPGWRVPTEADLDELLIYLGGAAIAGAKMKEAGNQHFLPPNTGATNEVQFRALAAGKYDTAYELLQMLGMFWLAEEGTPVAPIAIDATEIGLTSFMANWLVAPVTDGYLLDVASDIAFVNKVAGYDGKDVGKVLTALVNGLIGKTTVINIIYGFLYNWYAATDVRNIANTGWHVPICDDWHILRVFADPLGNDQTNVAGGKLKETGLIYWNSPNAGATNILKFNDRGSGYRSEFGDFAHLNVESVLCTSEYVPYSGDTMSYVAALDSSSDRLDTPILMTGGASVYLKVGVGIRLVKDSTILSDGQTGTYTGNDGKVYPTICIGTQEWLACNLAETKYRNGDLIPEITDNAEWGALTTGALCAYNNDWNNVVETIITLLPYYYRLRAYVGTAQSPNSNIITVGMVDTGPNQYIIYDDGTTQVRKGVRNASWVIDITLNATGFAGVETIDEGVTGDWMNLKTIIAP